MNKGVFIGVGHGGSDPGAKKYVVEKDANLTIALEQRRVLEMYGITVGMSRTVDENDPIGEEIREANAFVKGFDIDSVVATESHNNAGRGDGFEIYIQTGEYAAQSRRLAELIEEEVKAIGQNSRGIKTKLFGWTCNVNAPAVLCEGFFVDNWNDAKDFDTVEEQRKLGRAYARGVLRYYGIDPDSDLKETEPAPEPAATYTVTASGSVAYENTASAENAAAKLKELGFTGYIASSLQVEEIKVGSTVRVKQGAKYYDDGAKDPPNPVLYNRIHKVHQINGDRVVLTYSNIVVGAVRRDDLIRVEG